MDKKPLCIATRNQNKVHEMEAALSQFWEVKCSGDYPALDALDDIAETGDTFLANAQIKAVTTSQVIENYVLADDSGLECDALDGAPGVFSARYGGIPSSTEKNTAKLLQELDRVGAENAPAAERALSLRPRFGKGRRSDLKFWKAPAEGTIALASKGTNGFGYDPLFVPQGYARTFGQLGEKTKITLSHRGLALQKFVEWCKANPG